VSEIAQPLALRSGAETLAAPLPPLLAAAEHLAANLILGAHGRRRSGLGDEFWQYRPLHAGDEARTIDWRRSARSDGLFVREKEWQAAQSVLMWVDRAQSMGFASTRDLPSKADRAATLALALGLLLIRGGERVGLTDLSTPPRSGQMQIIRLADALSRDHAEADFGAPEVRGMTSQSRAVFVSDFLGDIAEVETALTKAADKGVKGAILQVLDPQEEAFPFDGRTIFESMGGGMRHETMKAGDLRGRYLDRLAERKAALSDLARVTGWQYHCHHTDASATAALLWLYGAMERDH
jgi:uncharacterized protein (DUF58 family)